MKKGAHCLEPLDEPHVNQYVRMFRLYWAASASGHFRRIPDAASFTALEYECAMTWKNTRVKDQPRV